MQVEVVVIGAGHAGLAAAHHLARAGLRPGTDLVVLDDSLGPGGAWGGSTPGVRLGDVRDLEPLPGAEVVTGDPSMPLAEALATYHGLFEDERDLQVLRPVHVRSVGAPGGRQGSLQVTTTHGTWTARGVVNATGSWSRPFVPACPGRPEFTGTELHARDLRDPTALAGADVVLVGAGTAAVHLVPRLTGVSASTTWVARRPARRSRTLPEPRPLFDRLVPEGVHWAEGPEPGTHPADVVVWATGFRPALRHLAPLRLRGTGGAVLTDGTQVVADPRVQLVGAGQQPAPTSLNRAGREAARNLRRLLGF
ncbi:FAD-dependent oxidoreductase [Cellulomonas bogoriensis]|uniref:Pyridine nucleotide-disulfide oxidoreductase n=1 Tax=Cellulomonas bogoriensis 69B4 = DSM 16987 TaxID=1386082 RepID=A0A0A0BUX6_9CELL|nr:FAD-dependent oxidoreductase [Cellulomonas bogoriensis]KGM11512.1 pyridine nucleotide-disulfide oxidoreductase [Cellulomonas bogoriensis 69B4 = DSM 16987]